MYKILVVDDKEIFLRTIKKMPFFQTHGERAQLVWAFHNASQALAVLRSEKVDIVLTDIRMPGMSGLDLLKVIQKDGLCGCTILMSEYAEFTYAREGILYGAFDYIVKPLEDAAFAETMRRAIAFLDRDGASSDDAAYPQPGGADMGADLLRVFQGGDEAALEAWLRSACARFLKKDPAAPPDIHPLRDLILQPLCAEYPCLAAYFPLEILFEKADPCTPAEAFDCLRTHLLFLRRKMDIFHTDSGNMQVQSIWHYTITNIEAPCRLSETAQRFFLNSSYLSTLFKKETGISYKAFVQRLKMERAKCLLARPGQKISAIADRLHYSDAEYFRKTFKAATGVSPAKFDYHAYIRQTVL